MSFILNFAPTRSLQSCREATKIDKSVNVWHIGRFVSNTTFKRLAANAKIKCWLSVVTQTLLSSFLFISLKSYSKSKLIKGFLRKWLMTKIWNTNENMKKKLENCFKLWDRCSSRQPGMSAETHLSTVRALNMTIFTISKFLLKCFRSILLGESQAMEKLKTSYRSWCKFLTFLSPKTFLKACLKETLLTFSKEWSVTTASTTSAISETLMRFQAQIAGQGMTISMSEQWMRRTRKYRVGTMWSTSAWLGVKSQFFFCLSYSRLQMLCWWPTIVITWMN